MIEGLLLAGLCVKQYLITILIRRSLLQGAWGEDIMKFSTNYEFPQEIRMAVEIDVVYEGDLRCVATHGPSGHTLPTDAPVDNGGRGAEFSPTDLVGTALATCILTIMGLAAKRAGISLDGTRAHVTKEMTKTGPRRIAGLKVNVAVAGGRCLSGEQRDLLERAANSCPVKQSLHPDVAILIDYSYI